MKLGLAALAMALVMVAPMAYASGLDRRAVIIMRNASNATKLGDPASALAQLTPLIDEYEQEYAGKREIYCADTSQELARYRSLPGAGGGSSRITGGDNDKPGRVLLRDSNWCDAQYLRAYVLVELKRLDEAQAALERLLTFAPQRVGYLNELGYVLATKRKWQPSIDTFARAEAAAELKPAQLAADRCRALVGQGYGLIELGRYEDADVFFRKCLAIDPGNQKALNEIEYIREQRLKTT